ncbi:MAG: ABC transporter ATP-binding protein [Alphaproteobacteria bacterium]|jgi:branched-chain amino acid transport system ATP-binding protein|nr:ABC transporter ATP-binding protein [Alphaproteobacteria bacterium]MBT4018522.1 ABC transporter ATP-binding protein [Alphaproteobacteria bacterium]MBT5162179.1 ABC transporter ATP-binding protein [Alphaproteobacteria bacterium]MBT6387928.1 ABC transporter ATP-binding protein [Alphaproteobacteria bacterium]
MLKATSLNKSFGSLVVTDNVSLHVPAGGRHAVIGPNGAGKTTFFNLLTGEIKANSGQVVIDGQDISSASPDARARAGLGRSFQKNNLFMEMTVLENLATASAVAMQLGKIFWKSFQTFSAVRQAAEEIAGLVNLADVLKVPVKNLSYGHQRQLEVGLALATRPKVLMLDEPTSGMSPEETAVMLKLISSLPRTLTILIIEHDMEVVFGVTDRITVLDYGSVLVEGTVEEVRNSEIVRQRYLGEAIS